MVLAEFNTHRMFSRNSASSRAIPFKRMAEMVEKNPFVPLAWQFDHKGMQGTEYVTDLLEIGDKRLLWKDAAQEAVNFSKALNKNGITKQLCNRLLEPFMWHTVIVTATDWENFFKLRCPRYKYTEGVYFYSRKEYNEWALDQNEYYSDDKTLVEWLEINEGQAEIHVSLLAEAMYDALNESTPKKLKAGEWHIPFGDNIDEDKAVTAWWNFTGDEQDSSHEDAFNKVSRKIAVARCARVSYQTFGDNPKIDYEADIKLHDMLAKNGHSSPFEHVARVMDVKEYALNWRNKIDATYIPLYDDIKEGRISYGDCTENQGWCRNFRGFTQYRELLEF
jgi:hypothetical protein